MQIPSLERPRDVVAARIVAATGRWAAGLGLDEIRADFETLLAGPEPATTEAIELAGRPATLTRPIGAPEDAVVFYCHGGGFQIGSPRSHRSLIARLAEATGVSVVAPDYRLAPEHRFPAAIDDCIAAHGALIAGGMRPGRIVLAGDSAGGNLALGVALAARDRGEESAAAMVLISPWLDLAMRGESYVSRAAVDVFSKPEQLRLMARTYVGRGGDASAPRAAPLDQPLHGLPPTLVHAGDCDITRDDSVLFAERALAAGGTVDLEIWPEMFHHFQVFAELPEAARSIAAIGRFVRDRLTA